MSDYIKAFDEFDSDGDSGKREETKGVRGDIELWFALHPVGPATAERQLLNDAADEIERLRARVHVCPTCGEECVECQCMREKLAECRRLLREAAIRDGFVDQHWVEKAARAAGGDDA